MIENIKLERNKCTNQGTRLLRQPNSQLKELYIYRETGVRLLRQPKSQNCVTLNIDRNKVAQATRVPFRMEVFE